MWVLAALGGFALKDDQSLLDKGFIGLGLLPWEEAGVWGCKNWRVAG